MFEAQGTKSRSVLISGVSIAGPALAYWLNQYGFDVTVVERADAIRSGGYPIDVRGTAIDVVERMGVLPQLRAAHVDTGKLRFVDTLMEIRSPPSHRNTWPVGRPTVTLSLPLGELD